MCSGYMVCCRMSKSEMLPPLIFPIFLLFLRFWALSTTTHKHHQKSRRFVKHPNAFAIPLPLSYKQYFYILFGLMSTWIVSYLSHTLAQIVSANKRQKKCINEKKTCLVCSAVCLCIESLYVVFSKVFFLFFAFLLVKRCFVDLL